MVYVGFGQYEEDMREMNCLQSVELEFLNMDIK